MIKNSKVIDDSDILKLYEANGWTNYTDNLPTLIKGINNSLDCFTYYEEDILVGLVRVVGDGVTIIYIQDILVLPEYHSKGVGSLLIGEVTKKYKNVRQIVLMTDSEESQHKFYEKNGFGKISTWGGVAFNFKA